MAESLTTQSVAELTAALIRQPSVTPEDAGCQALMGTRLSHAGFTVEELPVAEVSNFWATHGQGGPLLVFAGHTDVVPPGPRDQWHSDPFIPEVRGDYLYGRGAADMKSSLAAMVCAAETFTSQYPKHPGTLALLITSDEEGPAINGTRAVVDILTTRNIQADYCIVGEPSSRLNLGDVVRNGRRGSLNGTLTFRGVQGHVAYPDDADNPIHKALPALTELASRKWDDGNAYFPPTSFQIANLNAGTGATNVIPGILEAGFNFRFSSEQTSEKLIATVSALLESYQLQPGQDFTIEWQLSGNPFITEAGPFTDIVSKAITQELGVKTQLSTGGGTSDGRFIAPTGCKVIELGPVNATIHKVNECVAVADLAPLANIYFQLMIDLLAAE